LIALLVSAGAHAACAVISGVSVHTGDGVERGFTVVVANDRIAGVGATVAGLANGSWNGEACTVVDGAGKELTAGLVAAPTQIGLVEVGLERSSRDDDPMTEDPVRAALVAADAYDPLSTPIAVQRIHGITTALTAPTGGFVSGRAGWVQLHGATQAEAVLDRSVAMVATLPTASGAEALQQLRELVLDTRTHQRNPRLYDEGRPYFPGASRLDLESFAAVTDRTIPLLVDANDASALESLVRAKDELDIDIVVVGAAEGWLVAEQLAEANVPVIVNPLVYGPGGFDEVHARADNAARLHEAGVPLILTAGAYDSHNVRTLRQVAGNAVREGLPHPAAIRAITRTPVEVFGAGDRGRVAVGAVADLVLWSGDPLELLTRAEHVWIGGEEVELTSRQTMLRDKYRTLPGTPVPAIPLPTPN
jgi:imidazolonepropionase-like amidohydrolase